MGPEGNILVNPSISTFQQGLTHSALRVSVSYCFTQISNLQLMQCFTNKTNRDECRSQASDISQRIFQKHFQILRWLDLVSGARWAFLPESQWLFSKCPLRFHNKSERFLTFLEGFISELQISETFWKGAKPSEELAFWTFQNSLCIVYTITEIGINMDYKILFHSSSKANQSWQQTGGRNH